MPVLEHDQFVSCEVGKVDLLPGRDDPGMLPDTEPPNVGEQEASLYRQHTELRVMLQGAQDIWFS